MQRCCRSRALPRSFPHSVCSCRRPPRSAPIRELQGSAPAVFLNQSTTASAARYQPILWLLASLPEPWNGAGTSFRSQSSTFPAVLQGRAHNRFPEPVQVPWLRALCALSYFVSRDIRWLVGKSIGSSTWRATAALVHVSSSGPLCRSKFISGPGNRKMALAQTER